MFPLDIRFRNMAASDAIYNHTFEQAQKLERFYQRIISGTVTITAPPNKTKKGSPFHLMAHIHVPGQEIVVNRDVTLDEFHNDVYLAINDAFRVLTRRLEDFARIQRADVKHHENPVSA
jgi:ribosomal subunit interface protein